MLPFKVSRLYLYAVGYVFESWFSAGTIQPIASRIFGIFYKNGGIFKKMLFIFL